MDLETGASISGATKLALSCTVMAITNNYVRRRLKKDKDVSPMLSYFEDIQKEQEKGLEP